MVWQIGSFFLCLLAGSGIGYLLAQDAGVLVGVVLGGSTWLAIDLLRAARLLRWLRRGAEGPSPEAPGVWGELADRAKRALRTREQELAQASLRLREFLAAIQASPNGVVLLDADGRIEWCNATAAAHLGIDMRRDEMQALGHLLRDPDFAAYSAGADFTHEITIAGRNSSASRPVRLSIQLHPYADDRKLLLSRDVTALEQAEVMRRDFVANVSHEIRTPLTVLSGFIETLQTLELNAADRTRFLRLMAQQSERMQILVDDLLTLSSLEGSARPGTGAWIGLPVLMGQCEQEARALSAALGKDQMFTFSPAPAWEVAGVASELLSAMSNLISNAVRYTPAKGSIAAAWCVLPDASAEFSVRDTGPGIAPEHLPRLTERFYRVDRSRSRETGGTGLGLAIVKHVVQRHGGELRIESAPGAGATFTISLPAARLRKAQELDEVTEDGRHATAVP